METTQPVNKTAYSPYRSYPTYEEWKPFIESPTHTYVYGSYPTYEEWKPPSCKEDSTRSKIGSYPTYEEWKHGSFRCYGTTFQKFLSYL